MNNSWTQLPMWREECVTEVTILIGAVGTDHLQWMISVEDETGTPVGQQSVHHAPLVRLDEQLAEILKIVGTTVLSRHSPF